VNFCMDICLCQKQNYYKLLYIPVSGRVIIGNVIWVPEVAAGAFVRRNFYLTSDKQHKKFKGY